MCNRIRAYAPKKGQKGSNCERKTHLYRNNGSFVRTFASRLDCATFIGTHLEEIIKCIRLRQSHKGFIFLNEYLGGTIDVSCYNIRKIKTRGLYKICPVSQVVIEDYESITGASKMIGVAKEALHKAIKKAYRCRGFYWSYKENLDSTLVTIKNKRKWELRCTD
jgi:hypothetical protein